MRLEEQVCLRALDSRHPLLFRVVLDRERHLELTNARQTFVNLLPIILAEAEPNLDLDLDLAAIASEIAELKVNVDQARGPGNMSLGSIIFREFQIASRKAIRKRIDSTAIAQKVESQRQVATA